MLKLESNIDLDATPDVKFEIVSVELNGAAVDFDASQAVMSEDAATASDQYSDWDFSIANTARVQLINVYDGVAAVPNDTYESVKITFDVTGLGGGAAEEDTAVASTETTATDTTTTSDKGSPDTGVEGVAVVAGAAIVAGGVLLLSKKRK
jgi:hypothetical protein